MLAAETTPSNVEERRLGTEEVGRLAMLLGDFRGGVAMFSLCTQKPWTGE